MVDDIVRVLFADRVSQERGTGSWIRKNDKHGNASRCVIKDMGCDVRTNYLPWQQKDGCQGSIFGIDARPCELGKMVWDTIQTKSAGWSIKSADPVGRHVATRCNALVNLLGPELLEPELLKGFNVWV
jgi:hypothetical protein